MPTEDHQRTRPARVLLVEDNPDDALLLEAALREVGRRVDLTIVTDGVEALDLLRGRTTREGFHRPDLVLLDLSLPRKLGRETLAEIRSDPSLRGLPVVVVTGSDDAALVRSWDASAFYQKPLGRKELSYLLDRFVPAVRHAP